MVGENHVLYVVVMATLASLKLCNGQAVDAGDVVQSPTVQGSLYLRSTDSDAEQEYAAVARHGSLAFRFDEESDQTSSSALHSLMDRKLRHMDPSVQCGDNLMTLKVKGVRAPHFLVDSGEGPLIPLAQMPSKCGFSVKRSRRDLLFSVPYQGCHVTKQDDDYVLPLRLWGEPMTMSCPIVSQSPSVSCFPSGMVVNLEGFTANELKVKESGVWKSVSSACSSCGLALEVFSGGLTLTAPYNKGLCIEIKDNEYLLSLLLVDIELLATCPSLLDITSFTPTTTSPNDNGYIPQYPQYSPFPDFPQYPVFPEPTPPAYTPATTTSTVAPPPQQPQLSPGSAAGSSSKTENQEVSADQQSFPFMYQFPHYIWLPRPVPPMQSSENVTAPLFQSPPFAPQINFPPQFAVGPGIFYPTIPPPPAASSTNIFVTTSAHTPEHKKPHVFHQPQFTMPPPYPFPAFSEDYLSSGHPQAVYIPQSVFQQPIPHVYSHGYHIPVLYSSQRQNAQSAAPAITSTTTAATTLNSAAQNPFYLQPYNQNYYAPQQAPISFPNPAPFPHRNFVPSYSAIYPFYYQKPGSAVKH